MVSTGRSPFIVLILYSSCISHCKSDILPEEGVWFWKSGMPLLSGLRKLAVGTLMGPQKEKQINWYLEPGPLEKLINHLTPNLDKIAKIIQHHAVSVCSSISC
jgi:hypothetical protein